MHLIADSGSTKTKWSLIEGKLVVKEVTTLGINPFYQNENEIASEIEIRLMPHLKKEIKLKSISFYGAGCSFPEKKELVRNALNIHFPNTNIEVESDLLGAARSLFGKNEGIACILGTGSNSCYYDGNVIIENVSPLGFILGDEGSGAVLAKALIADCLKKQLPDQLCEQFIKKYNFSPALILENVYKKPFPNRYLAQFTPFLSENIDEPAIEKIVYNGFVSFFQRNITHYPKGKELGFVGSVAFHLQEVLRKVAEDQAYKIATIVKDPMEGLVYYHSHAQ
jgi:N-acetylglucosamine kinase-like BadF-type ATPase